MCGVRPIQEHFLQHHLQWRQRRRSLTWTAAASFAPLLLFSCLSVVRVSSLVVPTAAPLTRNSNGYFHRCTSTKSFNSNALPTAATPLSMSSKVRARELPAPRTRRETILAPPTIRDEEDTGGAAALPVPLPQPPKDDTYSIRGRIREMRASGAVPRGVNRYDGIGKKTGGIWRSRLVGFVPSTVRAIQ